MRTNIFTFLIIISCISLLYSCKPIYDLSVCKESNLYIDKNNVELYKLKNKNGMFIKVTNLAGSLTDVCVPDKNNNFEHVVLGFDSLKCYFSKHPKLGATVGRYANRIKNAQFRLDDHIYNLDKNNNGHSIHGGKNGFNKRCFKTDTIYIVKDTAVVVFKYNSAHLEEGFPGNLELLIAYKLTNDNEIILDYTAKTDMKTVINLTNHSYFNLSGCKEGVLNHYFKINADSITLVDSDGIPTGELTSVEGTKYDFSFLRTISDKVKENKIGYDINYKLNKRNKSLQLAATIEEPKSGRVLKAYTTEPGMQFYIPSSNLNYINGHDGKTYGNFYGFCLEMQHFPDSPNNSHFPSTYLLPGEKYRQITVYKFETKKDP